MLGPWPRFCCLVTPAAPLGTVEKQGGQLVQENAILLLEAKSQRVSKERPWVAGDPAFSLPRQPSNL